MIYLNNQNSNVRRIDELGRIVIPKDIRKKLHINNNEPLEIYIQNEEIIIKKYSSLPEIKDFTDYLIDIGNRITNNKYIITNRTEILSSTNKDLIGNTLSSNLESYCLTATEIKNEHMELSITSKHTINGNIVLLPLLIDGDRSGVIIEYNEEKKPCNSAS